MTQIYFRHNPKYPHNSCAQKMANRILYTLRNGAVEFDLRRFPILSETYYCGSKTDFVAWKYTFMPDMDNIIKIAVIYGADIKILQK